MTMNPDPTSTPRPQRLVRSPTNPMASRPAPRAEPAEPIHAPAPATSGLAPAPIESIAVDLQGAPGWRLALIALGVGLVSLLGLLVAS